MGNLKKLISLLLALSAVLLATPAWVANAEDEVGIAVDVLSTEGAPKVRANFFVPLGKPSDAAKISLSLAGFEPNRDVFFSVTPLPDSFARELSDAQGKLKAKLELPYGLEPGSHEIVARTFFSSDDIPASYTVGQIFVSDFGLLTAADGTFPKGTRPAPVLIQNSAQSFASAPTYLAPKGSLRVSEPQLRISQSWLPTATVGLSFENSTATPATFGAKITLFDLFGSPVGQPYFANIDGLPVDDSKTLLLKYPNLPPFGFFTLRTELQLPSDFAAAEPVATTVSSSVFAAPLAAWGIVAFLVLTAGASLALSSVRKRNLRKGYHS